MARPFVRTPGYPWKDRFDKEERHELASYICEQRLVPREKPPTSDDLAKALRNADSSYEYLRRTSDLLLVFSSSTEGWAVLSNAVKNGSERQPPQGYSILSGESEGDIVHMKQLEAARFYIQWKADTTHKGPFEN